MAGTYFSWDSRLTIFLFFIVNLSQGKMGERGSLHLSLILPRGRHYFLLLQEKGWVEEAGPAPAGLAVPALVGWGLVWRQAPGH
jgi:hypothetical protein